MLLKEKLRDLFCKEKSKMIPTYIYGLGEETEELLQTFPDYPFVGLLDGVRENGEMWGKPIVPLRNLKTSGSRIIIMARKSSEDVILRRIAPYCRKQKIIVYSSTGTRLNLCTKITGRSLKSAEAIGRFMLAPVIKSFVLWIEQKAKENRIEQVIFPARDGYLLQKAFKMVSKRPSLYLFTSRSLCTWVGLKSKQDIVKAAYLPFSGGVEEMLRKRFRCSQLLDNKLVAIDQIQECYGNEILARAAETRQRYVEYLRKTIKNGNTAYIDFVSRGTCQRYLEDILDRNFYGLYFEQVKIKKEKRVMRIESFIEDGGNVPGGWNYLYVEPFIKEMIGTAWDVGEEGSFIYNDISYSIKQQRFIQNVQNVVLSEIASSGKECSNFRDESYSMDAGISMINFDVFTNRKIEYQA